MLSLSLAIIGTDHPRPQRKIEHTILTIIGRPSSLVTTLRVAEKFEQSHLESPQVLPLIEAAQVFYVEGYFLTHGTSAVEWLSKKSSAANKVSLI